MTRICLVWFIPCLHGAVCICREMFCLVVFLLLVFKYVGLLHACIPGGVKSAVLGPEDAVTVPLIDLTLMVDIFLLEEQKQDWREASALGFSFYSPALWGKRKKTHFSFSPKDKHGTWGLLWRAGCWEGRWAKKMLPPPHCTQQCLAWRR